MSNRKITVYSKPACFQCVATKRQLDDLGVDYVALEIADHPEILDLAREHGVASAPIVVVETPPVANTVGGLDVWGGFDPDRLKALA
jgi:glutaredoxin-like protein NrdH